MEAKIIYLDDYQSTPENKTEFDFPYVFMSNKDRKDREIKFKKECQARLEKKLSKQQAKIIWLNITW